MNYKHLGKPNGPGTYPTRHRYELGARIDWPFAYEREPAAWVVGKSALCRRCCSRLAAIDCDPKRS
eukprot:139279-Rhodomonas_salina.1